MINIDDETYRLSDDKYIKIETTKNKIVILNTFNNGMDHFTYWDKLMPKRAKRSTTYTVDEQGGIYEHFDSKYTSSVIGGEYDKSIISISVSNRGQISSDVNEECFYDTFGRIYDERLDVYVKAWKGYSYWQPYTNEQISNTAELVKMLCDKHNIPKRVIDHNSKMDNADTLNGVLYRSNFKRYYTDISPSWKFDIFKDIVEYDNETINK